LQGLSIEISSTLHSTNIFLLEHSNQPPFRNARNRDAFIKGGLTLLAGRTLFALSSAESVPNSSLRPPQVHELHFRYQGEEITVDSDKVDVGSGALRHARVDSPFVPSGTTVGNHLGLCQVKRAFQ